MVKRLSDPERNIPNAAVLQVCLCYDDRCKCRQCAQLELVHNFKNYSSELVDQFKTHLLILKECSSCECSLFVGKTEVRNNKTLLQSFKREEELQVILRPVNRGYAELEFTKTNNCAVCKMTPRKRRRENAQRKVRRR